VRHLRLVSYAMTVAGVLAVAVAAALDLPAVVVLVGLMLVVAGVVKIAVVGLWHGAFGFGVPLEHHDAARERAIEEGRR
jgi:hypothetical protein